MKKETETFVNVRLPTDLRERARAAGQELKTTTTQIIRDALRAHLDYLEAKIRSEKERAAAEKAERRAARGFRPLTPLREDKPEDKGESQAPEVAPEYVEHATRIAEAVEAGSRTEVRLRTAEAVAVIKKRYPLTHPPESEIIATLEQLVLSAQKKNAATQQYDPPREIAATQNNHAAMQQQEVDPHGHVIDVTKLRSFGNVPLD